MSHKILLRVTAPAVAVGVLLFAGCLVSIGYISRLQSNLDAILSQNVASLQAAEELEICVRQLRHHNLLYLMEPEPNDLGQIATDQQQFEGRWRLPGRPASPATSGRRWKPSPMATSNTRRSRRNCGPTPTRNRPRPTSASYSTRTRSTARSSRARIWCTSTRTRSGGRRRKACASANRQAGRWCCSVWPAPSAVWSMGYGVARGLSRSDLPTRRPRQGPGRAASTGCRLRWTWRPAAICSRSTGRCRRSSDASRKSPKASSSTSATCCAPTSWPPWASSPPASPTRSATR